MSGLPNVVRGCIVLSAFVCLFALSKTASARDTLISLATAGKQGIYYPAGGAICRLVNRGRFEHGIRCLTETTQGSVANLRGVRDGRYDFGIVQSDWHYHAYYGSAGFKDFGRDSELRSLFSLHTETFTVVARRGSGIRSLADLKAKRVNVGLPGSGSRATLAVVLEVTGLSETDLALAAELPSHEQALALCDGTLDAVVNVVGHPNRSIEDMANACDTMFVPVAGDAIDELLKTRPYYRPAKIPGGMYAGNPEAVETFGLGATVVTSVRTNVRAVVEVMSAVFDNLDKFKGMHPSLGSLDAENMQQDFLVAPQHIGAIRYFLRSSANPR